jgi:YD repeat-containing protein
VLTVTDPLNGVWTNTYDSHGNLLTTKNALNNTLAAFLLSNPRVLITELEIHQCMKSGGKWVYLTNSCKFEKSP